MLERFARRLLRWMVEADLGQYRILRQRITGRKKIQQQKTFRWERTPMIRPRERR